MEQKNSPKIRFPGFTDEWLEYSMGELYTERKEPGNDSLPILSVSIHTGISDGELDEEGLGKTVRRSEDKSTYKHVYAGDLVFNMMRAWQGAIGSAPSEGMISPAYISAKPNEKVYPPFMDYYVKRKELIEQINSLSYGVTDFRKRLYWDSFVKVKCKLPSVDEQKRIADTIAGYDRIIAKQEKELDCLKNMKKGMLQKMFPKEGESGPEIRFPGFGGVWEQRKFSDFIQRESTFRVSSIEYPSVEYEDVVAEEGRLNKDIRQKVIKKAGIIFDETHVLYGKLRPYLHNWLNPDFTGVAVGDWWVLRPLGVNKKYVYRLIQTQQFDEVANQSSGSKMPRADWNLVSNIEFTIPFSMDEQRKIADVFDDFDNLIILHQQECDKWKELKKGLLQQMFV